MPPPPGRGVAAVLLALYFIVVCLAVFLCFVDSNYNMLFRTSYVLTGTPACSVVPVPRILHQTWKSSDIPATHAAWVKTWRHGLPDWTHVLHTDADMERFVRAEFPYYMPVWTRLHPFIKRVDTIRYMWMLRLGGVYADLDTSLENVGKVLDLLSAKLKPPVAFVPTSQTRVLKNKDRASPAFLASHKNHPFWIYVLQCIAENGWNPNVLKATGPIALTNAVKRWACSGETASLLELSEPYLGIGPFRGVFPNPIVRHHNSGMWRHGKSGKVWDLPDSVFEGLRLERAALGAVVEYPR